MSHKFSPPVKFLRASEIKEAQNIGKRTDFAHLKEKQQKTR